MIEAGHIGHYGLLIRPQCTHDVYASPSRQRKVKTERGRMKPKLPKATQSCIVIVPYRMWEQGEEGGEMGSPCLLPQLIKFLLSPPPPPTLTPGGGMSEGTRRGEESFWRQLNCEFKVGTQTHTSVAKSSLIGSVSGRIHSNSEAVWFIKQVPASILSRCLTVNRHIHPFYSLTN